MQNERLRTGSRKHSKRNRKSLQITRPFTIKVPRSLIFRYIRQKSTQKLGLEES